MSVSVFVCVRGACTRFEKYIKKEQNKNEIKEKSTVHWRRIAKRPAEMILKTKNTEQQKTSKKVN